MELAEPFFKTGRNITCDNYFTDYDLAMNLLHQQLTLVGTVKKNKRFIPIEFQPKRGRAENSSIFGFQAKCTLVSYVPKKNKAVILLSTMHHTDDIVVEKNRKPEIIEFYNETKVGVDALDQMIHAYMSIRRIRRWPMTYFFNLLDLAGVAAFVVWISTHPHWNENKTNKRCLFLHEVTEGLVRAHILKRFHITAKLPREIVTAMESMVGPLQRTTSTAVTTDEKGRCYLCTRERDRKGRTSCEKCKKHVCPEHSKTIIICEECGKNA